MIVRLLIVRAFMIVRRARLSGCVLCYVVSCCVVLCLCLYCVVRVCRRRVGRLR